LTNIEINFKIILVCKTGSGNLITIESIGKWLSDEPKGWKVISYIGLYLALALAESYLLLWFLSQTFNLPANNGLAEMLEQWGLLFLPVLFLHAAVEETVFRFLILSTIRPLWDRNPRKYLEYILFFSLLFGAFHSSIGGILIQGLNGILISLLFLKCGGFNYEYKKALATSSLAHFLFNAITALPLLINIKWQLSPA
jgi:membrane protease YdiL (CAAX protease family)